MVLRKVFRVDLQTALGWVHTGGQFDTAVRFLDNTARAVAGLVTWIVISIVVWIPWLQLSSSLHSSNPHLSRAVADIGGGLVASVTAGFCIYLLRMGVSFGMAQRETGKAYARVSQAAERHGTLSPPKRGVGAQIALLLTTPRDIDFAFEACVGLVVFAALVNYAHSQGYAL